MGVLHQFSFSLREPTLWADLSETGGLLCASEMRKGVNDKRCKYKNINYIMGVSCEAANEKRCKYLFLQNDSLTKLYNL